jgi:hypothetical protein
MMNERINALAVQAKIMAEEDINKQISYNTELKTFAENFAELIVKECASFVNSARLIGVFEKEPEKLPFYIMDYFGVE